MPQNKKKKGGKPGKTKVMKRAERGLPPVSAPAALCFAPATPKGCIQSLYVRSEALRGCLVYGCSCPLTSTTCCCDKLTPTVKYALAPCTNADGYTEISGRCPHNVLENAKMYRRTQGLELRARVGVYGFADTNGRDVHVVYGGEPLGGRPFRDMNDSFHTWLEDADGLIYDHVDPQAIELGDICGADTSRVSKSQRFVGVSRQEMFSTFGVWCESQKFGIAMQNRLNAEIEMGFTEPWPRGVRCG